MEKTYPQSALVSIRRQAMIYNCACPAQVAETIAHLRKLYDYQAACLNEVPMDAAVHQRIAEAAERAHREMEACLREILAIEGWDPVTLQMPAHLEKRLAGETGTASAPHPDRASVVPRILAFLAEIGIVVHERPLPADTFLPGILVERGELVVDLARLAHPGDLLHEAGHIAVTLPAGRAALNADLQSDPGEEMAAIAWSYAAALHLGIDPAVVFHPDGYKGQSAALLDNFTHGRAIGVPLLQWYGLTRERDDGSGAAVFPRMRAWLRTAPPA